MTRPRLSAGRSQGSDRRRDRGRLPGGRPSYTPGPGDRTETSTAVGQKLRSWGGETTVSLAHLTALYVRWRYLVLLGALLLVLVVQPVSFGFSASPPLFD